MYYETVIIITEVKKMLLSKIIPSLVIITSVFVPSISPRLKAQTLISINYPEPPEQTERNTNNDGTAGGGARNPKRL